MVVGVGASAGGLEAFKHLLAHLPADTAMAFVFVMHLDPTHESVLTELLAGVTRMPVSEVQDGIDDVTERLEALAAMKEAEALRKSEERFRTLADNAPVLIWVNSPTGCEFVNREYLEFLGVGEAEVLGDKWAEFVHPEDLEDYVKAYHES